MEQMIEAIIREIEYTKPYQENKSISTLYFGGGTPSLLNATQLEKITRALHHKFHFSSDLEFTLEANPDDLHESALKEWLTLGVNRLSIGIQDFDDAGLKWMNRVHTAADSLACLDRVQESGFRNFSVDLIYGSPTLTDENWQRNLDLVIGRKIPHVSCYALTVEPGTALDKMIGLHKKEPVDPEKQASHFEQLVSRMEAAGYDHYEISNFALPGMQSNHNSSYWKGLSYYGFGPSAHSFNGKTRRWNIAHNVLYIESIEQGLIPFEEETLTLTQQLNEYIMTALRTNTGIDLTEVEKRFGKEHALLLIKKAEKELRSGLLIQSHNHLMLSAPGKLFADGIASSFFY